MPRPFKRRGGPPRKRRRRDDAGEAAGRGVEPDAEAVASATSRLQRKGLLGMGLTSDSGSGTPSGGAGAGTSLLLAAWRGGGDAGVERSKAATSAGAYARLQAKLARPAALRAATSDAAVAGMKRRRSEAAASVDGERADHREEESGEQPAAVSRWTGVPRLAPPGADAYATRYIGGTAGRLETWTTLHAIDPTAVAAPTTAASAASARMRAASAAAGPAAAARHNPLLALAGATPETVAAAAAASAMAGVGTLRGADESAADPAVMAALVKRVQASVRPVVLPADGDGGDEDATWRVWPSVIGADWACADGIIASASSPTPAQGFAAAASSWMGSYTAQRNGVHPLPPAVPLLAFGVRPRVENAWMATYGGETTRLARMQLRSQLRALQRRQQAALSDGGGSGDRPLTNADIGAAARAASFPLTPLQAMLWPTLTGYADISFAARTHHNERELRTLLALHIVNHISRARDAVVKHDAQLRDEAVKARAARLARGVDAAKRLDDGASSDEEGEGAGATTGAGSGGARGDGGEATDKRDQGFTRPRVLVLLPYKHLALQLMRSILRLLPGCQIANRARFFREFTEGGDGEEGDGDGADADAAAAVANPLSSQHGLASSVSKQVREMLSDLDESDDDVEEARPGDGDEEDGASIASGDGDAAAGAGATPSVGGGSMRRCAYRYNRSRQGWTAGLLAKYRRAVARAKSRALGEDDDGDRDEAADGGGGGGGEVDDAVVTDMLRAQGLATSDSESSDGEGGGAGGNGEGEDDEPDIDGSHLPSSALALQAGRRKFDDRIIRTAPDLRRDRSGKRLKLRKRKKLTPAAKARAERAAHRMAAAKAAIPADYRRQFRGNIEDDFRVGVAIGRKAVKLYADFEHADLIVASPLGLRRIVGGEGEKHRETDFLSSIEVLVMDQAEVLALQNWDHVCTVLDVINAVPRSVAGTDFGRVREVMLGGLAKHLRQTVILSGYATPEVNALMRKRCGNAGGVLSVRPTYAGTITRVVPTVKQVFRCVPVGTAAAAAAALAAETRTAAARAAAAEPKTLDDDRFAYFKSEVLPELLAGVSEERGSLLSHTAIYVPSYLDYVRLRNALDEAEAEFVTLCENSDDSDVSRSRNRFNGGLSPILLMTERFHFFRRLRVRGVRHLLFYAPPTVPWFYDEVVNWLGEAAAAGHAISVTVLYIPRADALALERIVGSARVTKMLAQGSGGGGGGGGGGGSGDVAAMLEMKDTFVFV